MASCWYHGGKIWWLSGIFSWHVDQFAPSMWSLKSIRFILLLDILVLYDVAGKNVAQPLFP